MSDTSSDRPEEKAEHNITYAADSAVHRQFMKRRTSTKQAAFFLPYLHSGMRLLDCGCGAGSVTVGLAEVVAPGEVVGIDIDGRQISSARSHAAEYGTTNVRFQTGDVRTLPFPDQSFDAVFSNGVLEYLVDPVAVLKEFGRVLKPEGVVGVRCTTSDGHLMWPHNSTLLHSLEGFEKLREDLGGDGALGTKLRTLCREAGLARVQASASYDVYGTAEAAREWARMVAQNLREETTIERWATFGLGDREMLEHAASAWEQWGSHPDAFYARARGEAIAWRD